VALTQTRIVGPTTLGATSAAIYSPTSGTIIIKQIVLTNYSASATTVDLWLLPSGITTVSNGYLILKSFSLAAYETVFLNTSLVMVGNVSTTGDRLHAVASAGSSVNVIMNAVVES